MKIVMIGVSGAGKGTQGKRLAALFKLAHLSTGDILRDEIKKDTDTGKTIASIIDKGGFMDDDFMAQVVKRRLSEEDCKNGFVLDGFPRTYQQAVALDNIIGDVDNVVYLDLPDEYVLDRLMQRQICPVCGESYNKKTNPPKNEDVCDHCHATLEKRADDNVEGVKLRIAQFRQMEEPLLSFYEQKGNLLKINAYGEINEVTKRLLKALGGPEWE